MLPLMRKATAMWLIQNTSLTFKQIADFCTLHILEVNALANDEIEKGIIPVNPILMGQLSEEEVKRCQKNPKATLSMKKEMFDILSTSAIKKGKRGKYTPIARRQDKPSAIMWILKNCPEMSNKEIVKLIGTTNNTIESIRKKVYWNYVNLVPQDPVILKLCSQEDMYKIYEEAKNRKKVLHMSVQQEKEKK